MGITALSAFENHSTHVAQVVDVENVTTLGTGIRLAPGAKLRAQMNVPWATSAGDFTSHRIDVLLDGVRKFSIWQDGDFVRFSADGTWQRDGRHVEGYPRSGIGLPAPFPVDFRTLIIQNDCVELVDYNLLPLLLPVPLPLLQPVGGTVGWSLCANQPPQPSVSPSVPKTSSVAFSIAAPASDAFDRGERNARFRYYDTGSRYAFRIGADGVVVASAAGRLDLRLTRSASYSERRKLQPENSPAGVAPPFELIASDGSRVFAKEKGTNRFYFATMDHLAIGGDDGAEVPIPSMYFKLDPEFNRANARREDLAEHLAGCFRGHPAVERIPLFRLVLESNVADFMVVRMQRRTWHLVDARPAMSKFDKLVLVLQLLHAGIEPMKALSGAMSTFGINKTEFQKIVAAISALVSAMQNRLLDVASAPPAWVPETYDDVSYCRGADRITLKSIRYHNVLDIGVGYVHMHEQYESVTGGELQPLKTGTLFHVPGGLLDGVTYMRLYQFVNGPIQDADCYIDGTCNFYALVQLKETVPETPAPDAFGLLYIDEQSFFTGRWRLAHPDDHKGFMGLSGDLDANPSLYGWNKNTYWCPFRAGFIDRRSRLAVSRQVVVVNGVDESKSPVLYSINSSYATLDRTWRWRRLPFGVKTPAANAPVVDVDLPPAPNTVYPETIRLREDMTLHVRGRDDAGRACRWYQRYLPATNTPVPPAGALAENRRPASGYTHDWKFLPEAAFAAAERFSHFGVYDHVDSRTQYYEADGVPEGAAQGPWIDRDNKLFVLSVKFWWSAPLYPEPSLKGPRSLYNADTRLSLVKRGSRWIAMHWDKRDDKLLPFTGLPVTLWLVHAQTGQAIRVTLRSHARVDHPPAVQRAFVWVSGGEAGIAFVPLQTEGMTVADNVASAHLAALQGDAVVRLRDVTFDQFTFADGCYQHRWTPNAADLARLQTLCSPQGEQSNATSIWFEDLVGHVATAESVLVWAPPPAMRITVAPKKIPYGIPVPSIKVHAVDANNGQVLRGTVTLGKKVVAALDQDFGPRTFTRPDRDAPPEWNPLERGGPLHPHASPGAGVDPNAGTVAVEHYGDTAVPFDFYDPVLAVAVDRTSFTIGQREQFNVRVTDSTTQQPVPGAHVFFGTSDAGDVKGTFDRVFQAGDARARVVAKGYPDAPLAFTLAQPPPPAQIVNISVDPQLFPPGRTVQVLVRAQDSNTHAFIDGASVKFDGTAVGSTNVRFPYTAPRRPVARGKRLESRQPDDPVPTVITVTVGKPGYPDASIRLERS